MSPRKSGFQIPQGYRTHFWELMTLHRKLFQACIPSIKSLKPTFARDYAKKASFKAQYDTEELGTHLQTNTESCWPFTPANAFRGELDAKSITKENTVTSFQATLTFIEASLSELVHGKQYRDLCLSMVAIEIQYNKCFRISRQILCHVRQNLCHR